MNATRLDSLLKQIYRPERELSAAHLTELEARVIASFRERSPCGTASRRKRPAARRIVVATMVCGTALAASQLPVQYSVKVGELLTISVRPGDPVPPTDVLMPMLQQAGSTVARVQIRDQASGVVMIAQLWGHALAAGLPDELHGAFPSAQVSVTPMQGNLRATFLDKLRYELLDLTDPQKIAQARAAVQKELAARGENASVNISETNAGGRPLPRILVRVHGKSGDRYP